MSGSFLDSNVLIYAYTTDDAGKWRTATELLASSASIGVQCLNEFAAVARRELGFDWQTVATAVDDIMALCGIVVPITVDLHRRGLSIADRYRLRVYDAMIVSAALETRSGILYSEDMHDGLVIEGALTIRNPFA